MHFYLPLDDVVQLSLGVVQSEGLLRLPVPPAHLLVQLDEPPLVLLQLSPGGDLGIDEQFWEQKPRGSSHQRVQPKSVDPSDMKHRCAINLLIVRFLGGEYSWRPQIINLRIAAGMEIQTETFKASSYRQGSASLCNFSSPPCAPPCPVTY